MDDALRDDTTRDDEHDLLAAVTERALARAVLGAGGAGVLLGVIAVAFLAMSTGQAQSATLPVVLLLMVGQVGGLAAAAACVLQVRRVRTDPADARQVAEAAQRVLGRLAVAVAVAGVVVAVVMPLLVTPRGTAALMSAVGLGVLAQLVVVLTVLRRPLSRVVRAPQPPASR